LVIAVIRQRTHFGESRNPLADATFTDRLRIEMKTFRPRKAFAIGVMSRDFARFLGQESGEIRDSIPIAEILRDRYRVQLRLPTKLSRNCSTKLKDDWR
jgi:hypothetical protein